VVQQPAGDIARLIQRAKGYDREAFAELYRFAVGPVYRYLAARVDRVEEAEELTQEVFVAALAGIQTVRAGDENAFLAWLFQIARHKIADQLRLRYRRPSAPLEEAAEVVAPQPRPDEVAELEAERAEVREALERLTPDQREVIICKYLLDYDNERTALIVGKNINSVNQLHHRALASLHRLLTKPERAAT
jgi:RNA polymerase sigma-70 factor (ECF subfamily)